MSADREPGRWRAETDRRLDALEQVVAGQGINIANLIQRVTELEGGGGDPQRTTVSVSTWTPGEIAPLETALSAVVDTLVRIGGHRVFDNAGRWDAPTAASGRIAADIAAGRWSIASWTTYPSSAQIDQLLASIPAGHRLSVCCRHECDVPSKGVDPAQHTTLMAGVTEIIRAAGRPEITTRVTFTGYGGEVNGAARVRRYLDAGIADVVDHVSFDPYNTYGYNGQTKWTDPDELVGPWVELAAEYGFTGRLCIDETSCPEFPGDPSRKVGYLRRMHALAVEHGMPWWSYFSVQNGEISDGPDHMIQSSPESLAAFAEILAGT